VNAVVERCTSCGVEHEASHVGPCEVCGGELRYWCARHRGDAGWLEGPECPLCARETAARRAPPPPPPAPAPRVERRPSTRSPTRAPAGLPPRRDPREVLRDGAEEILPHVATGASVAFRLVRALFVLVRTVFLWALLGAGAGAAYAYFVGADPVWTAVFGLSNGAVVGLFFGVILALRTLFARRRGT
jgi:hypothetical protein